MRGEYGFNGFIVSDWMDVDRIHDLHHAITSVYNNRKVYQIIIEK